METGVSEETIAKCDDSSVCLAMEIMEYAHRNQQRENGEPYSNHPTRCMRFYRDLIGVGGDGKQEMDKDMLYQNGIPFDGVQEVCLLHDVVEDTDFTLDELRDIYAECGFEKYFDMYMRKPLEYITHDKSVDYKDYILKCLKNPTSALVKMIDLQDNLFVLDLVELTEKKYERAQRYLSYIYFINDVYHFIENAQVYKAELNSFIKEC